MDTGPVSAVTSPTELIAALSAWPMRSVPTFEELAAWIPEEIVDRLKALADESAPNSVAIIFLYHAAGLSLSSTSNPRC